MRNCRSTAAKVETGRRHKSEAPTAAERPNSDQVTAVAATGSAGDIDTKLVLDESCGGDVGSASGVDTPIGGTGSQDVGEAGQAAGASLAERLGLGAGGGQAVKGNTGKI